VTLVNRTLNHRFTADQPKRLIGDKAYDSDKLDTQLRQRRKIEMIAPHRFMANRKRPVTQDGRPLRRYRRRWKVERLFAWLHNFRRVVTRWDYYPANYLGFIQLACALILLRHF
jgi:transposase